MAFIRGIELNYQESVHISKLIHNHIGDLFFKLKCFGKKVQEDTWFLIEKTRFLTMTNLLDWVINSRKSTKQLRHVRTLALQVV